MKRVLRLVSLVLVMVGLMGGLALRPVLAAPPTLTLSPIDVDCEAMTIVLTWADLPADALIALFWDGDLGHITYPVTSVDPRAGQATFVIPFEDHALIITDLSAFVVHDGYAFGTGPNGPTETSGTFGIERECTVGFVSSSGTGSDDDAAAPTDARTDATTDEEEVEPAEDPDGEGRVQVP